MPNRAAKRQPWTKGAKSVVDAPESAEPEYYGAQIRDAKTGPRRELTLRIETWPKGKVSFGGGEMVTLRFGAIFNYEEVQGYFTKGQFESLHYLREQGESSPRRHIIEMEFDRTGDRVRIIAGKVSKVA